MGTSVLPKETASPATASRARTPGGIRLAALVLAIGALLLSLGAPLAGQPIQLEVTRIAILLIGGVVAAVAAIRYRDTKAMLQRVFWARDSAANLAVLRIATFAALWWLLSNEPIGRSMAYREFWAGPASIEWLFALIPPAEPFVHAAVVICKALCLLGILGILTRTTAATCALAGIYLLGIPSALKVNHFHHVIWFLVILSVARSSDRLSLAAAFTTSRPSPERSVHYGVPLRFAWLLIGLIYFFPGLFKLWTSGIDWIWTDNLVNTIMARTFPARTAIFNAAPPDEFWQISALAAVLFEVSFVVIVFLGDRVRAALAAAATMFHTMTRLIMGISFYHLLVFLPVLVNWHSFFVSIGKRLFGRRLPVMFNPACKKCLLLRSTIGHFDLLRRIAPTCSQSTRAIDYHASGHGLSVLRRIVARAPLVALPAAVASFGLRMPECPEMFRRPLVPLAIGAALALVQCLCGFTATTADWPFACYPLFDRRQSGIITRYSAELEKSDGTYHSAWLTGAEPALGKARIERMLQVASWAGEHEVRRTALRICRMACSSNPEWQGTDSIHIFQRTIRISPERPRGELLQSQPLYSFSREELSGQED